MGWGEECFLRALGLLLHFLLVLVMSSFFQARPKAPDVAFEKGGVVKLVCNDTTKLLKSPNFVVLGDDDALCKDFYSTLREAARSDSSTEGVEEFYLKSVLETPLSQQVHAKR